jgi:hypothetical protein
MAVTPQRERQLVCVQGTMMDEGALAQLFFMMGRLQYQWWSCRRLADSGRVIFTHLTMGVLAVVS